MNIYIMRHGEAGYAASSDAQRTLTAYGHEQCRLVAQWFEQQNITFQYALVSPYERARQTFSWIEKVHHIGRVEINKMLVPGGDPTQIGRELMALALRGVKSVLIVSHLPLVGYLVNELCPHVTLPMFSTADVACIELTLNNEVLATEVLTSEFLTSDFLNKAELDSEALPNHRLKNEVADGEGTLVWFHQPR